MGTNHYARFKVANSPVELKFHLGTSAGAGLSIISGLVFPTVEAWSTFLRFNKHSIELEDEYGSFHHDVETFIDSYLVADETSSKYSIDWLRKNSYTILDSPPETTAYYGAGEYWLDSGRLFHNAEFS